MRRHVVGVLMMTALLLALLPGAPAAGTETIPHVRHTVLDGLSADGGQAAFTGLSTRLLAPHPFSLVGVSVPQGSRVFLRTADTAGRWSPWQEAEALADDGDGPEPGSGEAAGAHPGWERMSEPLWVGEASWLQLRVQGARTQDVAVHLVDSLGLARSLWQRAADAVRSAWRGTTTATADASTRPPILSRAQWGADESLRRGSPSYSGSTRAGILHHTAGSNSYSAAQAPGMVRAIYAYHTRSLGWSDIGYNLLVDRFGTVYEGRAGGVERGVIGAHAGGFNTETFGVSILGTFTSDLPSGPALNAAVNTIAWKFRVHGINPDPDATVDMASRGSTRYAKGHTARLHTLSGHRDVSTTACPGDALYPRLPEVRRQVHDRALPPPPSPAPSGPQEFPDTLLPTLQELLPPLHEAEVLVAPSLESIRSGQPPEPPERPAPEPPEPVPAPPEPEPPDRPAVDLPLAVPSPLGIRRGV